MEGVGVPSLHFIGLHKWMGFDLIERLCFLASLARRRREAELRLPTIASFPIHLGRIMFRARHMIIVTSLLTPRGTSFVAVSPVTVPFSLLSSSAPGTAISPAIECTIPCALSVSSARKCVLEREDTFPPSDFVVADRLMFYWEQNQDESTGGSCLKQGLPDLCRWFSCLLPRQDDGKSQVLDNLTQVWDDMRHFATL